MNSGAYVSGKAKPSQTKKGPGEGRRKQGDDCRVHDYSLKCSKDQNSVGVP